MRVELFSGGLKGESAVVTAQHRINCFAEIQDDPDRTRMAIYGTPGKTLFTSIGGQPSRGMWAVNTLSTPLFFTVHSGTLYSVANDMTVTAIGMINTTTGNVSMVDNGTYLVLVDGTNGWYYNMLTPAGLNQIVDGNFTTSPKYITWQDTYFIVTSGTTNQFQLSDNDDPTVWPAVNINFTGTAPGALQAGIADHSILQLFGDVYAEFWQNAGLPDFPYAVIPGSGQEFGLDSAWSLAKYDNSLAGLFKNKMGEVNISRMSGFRLQRLSNFELEFLINRYAATADATGFSFMLGGHPMYQINFPTAGKSWLYDGSMQIWTELQDEDGNRDWGNKFCNFVTRNLVSDYRNGNIYEIDGTAYANNGETLPMEITSRHIWKDDKYLSIPQLQIDVESGIGLATGQGSNPQLMLEVSKDGGRAFVPVSWSSIGAIGEYTTRVIWRRLGRARDWVFRLRLTDPVKRTITGASAEVVAGAF